MSFPRSSLPRSALPIRGIPAIPNSSLPNSLLQSSPLRNYSVLACGLLLAACAQPPMTKAPLSAAAVPAAPANPFDTVSPLPYQLPAFDKISNADFMPAFEAGMKQQLQETAAIAANPQPPSFDNTIVAMERSGQELQRVSKVFFNLAASNTNPAVQKIEADMAPKLSAHSDAIRLDPKLFARIEALYGSRASLGLDAESLRLLERYRTQFVRAGARLDAQQKATLRGYNEQLSTLTTRFSQNTQKEKNASAVVVDRVEELDGLSTDDIAGAAEAAKARGLPGKYVIALLNTTGQPLLTNLKNRALRERIFRASIARGTLGNEFDNRELVIQITRLRADRAALLGYPNHAAYQLEDQTARTTDAVNAMLAKLSRPAVANARREAAVMQKMIDGAGGATPLSPQSRRAERRSADKTAAKNAVAKNDRANQTITMKAGGFPLAAWDWAHEAEAVRKAQYAFDEAQMRPYFELDHVYVDGIFYAAQKLYGLRFEERRNLPVYHPDVRVFEVFNEDGSALGLFLLDPFARESKRGGAWMNTFVDQSALFGTKPVVVNNLNIPKPPTGQPTLLTFDETRTAFHEFGHALHGLFSNVKYPMLSGTKVPRDFVEYPSQVNEMWAVWPEVLQHYAKHWQTGAPMPQALADKVVATRKFNQGFTTTEYLASATLDQAWHQMSPAQARATNDALGFEAGALAKAGLDFAPVPPRYRSTYFSHAFAGGYDAGYYAYIWSEVLDADSVEWFKANGGLKRANGDWFRAQLLSRGGSADAMALFRQFRGREPDIQPLLQRRGLD